MLFLLSVELDVTTKLNRHIGSIRRILTGRGSICSGPSGLDKSSPAIKLTDTADDAPEGLHYKNGGIPM